GRWLRVATRGSRRRPSRSFFPVSPHHSDGPCFCRYVHRSAAVSLAERNTLASQPLSPGGERMRAAVAAVPGVPGARRGSIDAVLPTRHAGTRKLRIAYELAGPAGAPVVFVAGGISAHRHVSANAQDRDAGWAEGLLDAGRTLDPA